MKISPILISTVLLSALLSSCANTKISNNESLVLAAQKEASQNQLSTAEIIEQASLNLSKARSEQLNFYAPLHISKADDKLKDAQKLNRKAETDEEKQNAKAAAISVQKLIDKAYKTKIIVEQQLAEAFERKTIVDDLGAKKALPKQYRKTIESLTLLIKEVEGGFFDAVAKDQPDLLEKFAKLEADTMRELWLEKAIIMLDKADDADADDFVEATYEKAEKAIDSANDFIDAHYRDRDGVKEAAFKAYNLASQAYYLAIEAEQLFKADEEEIESYLLKIQKRFNTINEEGYVENLPSHSFKEQAKLLAKQLDAQSKSLALTTAERDKLKLQLAGDASEETHNEADSDTAVTMPSLASKVDDALTASDQTETADSETEATNSQDTEEDASIEKAEKEPEEVKEVAPIEKTEPTQVTEPDESTVEPASDSEKSEAAQ